MAWEPARKRYFVTTGIVPFQILGNPGPGYSGGQANRRPWSSLRREDLPSGFSYLVDKTRVPGKTGARARGVTFGFAAVLVFLRFLAALL